MNLSTKMNDRDERGDGLSTNELCRHLTVILSVITEFLLGMISRRVAMLARESRSLIRVQNDELGAIKPQKETTHIFAGVSVLP